MSKGIFATWAPKYRKLGLEPRPIQPGSKASKIKGWQKPDAELGEVEVANWESKYADQGIGLRMGTPLPGGGVLGAIDVDDDRYVRLTRAILRGPISGRFGSKGEAYFVRIHGKPKNTTLKVENHATGETFQLVDCLFDKKLCVMPPTIHPKNSQPYEWRGASLLDAEIDALPCIDCDGDQVTETTIPFALLKTVIESEFALELFTASATHEPGLRLVGQIIRFTQDAGYIKSIIAAALPENYSGDTLDEIPGMIKNAMDKGFHKLTNKSGANSPQLVTRQFDLATAVALGEWPEVYKNGKPIKSLLNALVALARIGIEFESDTFHNRKKLGGHQLQAYQGDLTDDACAMLRNVNAGVKFHHWPE